MVEWDEINSAENLANDMRVFLENIDLLVLRFSKLKSAELNPDVLSNSKRFIERAPRCKILIVYSNSFKIKVKQIHKGEYPLPASEHACLVEELRQLELEDILRGSKALFPKSPEGTYMKSPSGAIVNSFIRTGNIQSSIHVLDIVFFWLIPSLRNVDSIVIDTWTISSIALNASRRLTNYINMKHRVPLYVDILSKYYGQDPDSRSELDSIVEGLRENRLANILFLFSATATGLSLRKLIEDISELSYVNTASYVSIYSFKESDISQLLSLCEIESLIDAQYKSESEVGANQIFVIDPDSYMPNILECANEVSNVNINKKLLDKSREFFSAYAGIDAIQVHRTYSESGTIETHRTGRHHAIYIEVKKLLLHTGFRKKLYSIVEKVCASNPPDILVSAQSSASTELAENIQEMVVNLGKRKPELYSTFRISENKVLTNCLRTLPEDTRVLVIDDVCITGTSLALFQGEFRDLGFRGRVDFLIGVMRAESVADSDNIVKYRSWSNSKDGEKAVIHAVESVILPNWSEEKCPWCTEERDLTKWLNNLDVQELPLDQKEFLEKRLNVLDKSATQGLVNNCFIHPINVAVDALWIEGGTHVSQADVVGAVASGLQSFRTEGVDGNVLGGRFPKRVILSNTDLFADNWQNTVLQTAIWRMALPFETQSADFTLQSSRISSLNDYLKKLDTGPQGLNISLLSKLYEVALAILGEKIPNQNGGIVVPASNLNSDESNFLKLIIDAYRR